LERSFVIKKSKRLSPGALGVLLALAACAHFSAGCARQAGELDVLPQAREGMFYTSLAEAQQVARKAGKHLLVDVWRPG
jgi:hypothetical protein